MTSMRFGLGRHSVLFVKNGFHVRCFDISEDAIARTKVGAEKEGLVFDYKTGDMLKLPYTDESDSRTYSSFHYHVHVLKEK